MNKAVFLDRDGTIDVEKNYLYKIEEFELIPGVIDALRILKNLGYLLIVITNQSGIGRGYYTEEDFDVLNRWMVEMFESEGIGIDAVYFCPHLPDAKIERYRVVCSCRKPAIGLFERAVKEFDIDLNRSWTVGDKLRDCDICKNSGCKGILIGANEKPDIIRDIERGKYRNLRYERDLLMAAKTISNSGR